ncbi:MAG: 5-formyltetrahydrofolate cyclo-ligase [Desulfotalea sp.]
MPDIIEIKKQFRTQARMATAQLSQSQKIAESSLVVESLKKLLAEQTGNIIMLYYPLSDEVDLCPLLEDLDSNWIILLPVITGADIVLKLYEGKEALVPEPIYNIPEPTGCIVNIKPDIIVVPGLAFSSDGSRMGRGKGYYDKFLSNNQDSLKIALSYSTQLYSKIPTEPHDYKMDIVISSERLIHTLPSV